MALEEQRRHGSGLVPAEQRIVERYCEVVIDLQTARVLARKLMTDAILESPARRTADAELRGARAKFEPPPLTTEVEEVDRPHRAHAVERAIPHAHPRAPQRILGELRAHVHIDEGVGRAAGCGIREADAYLPE